LVTLEDGINELIKVFRYSNDKIINNYWYLTFYIFLLFD
jgi:hypothetical protein